MVHFSKITDQEDIITAHLNFPNTIIFLHFNLYLGVIDHFIHNFLLIKIPNKNLIIHCNHRDRILRSSNIK